MDSIGCGQEQDLGFLFKSQKVNMRQIKELANIEKLEVAEMMLQETRGLKVGAVAVAIAAACCLLFWCCFAVVCCCFRFFAAALWYFRFIFCFFFSFFHFSLFFSFIFLLDPLPLDPPHHPDLHPLDPSAGHFLGEREG